MYQFLHPSWASPRQVSDRPPNFRRCSIGNCIQSNPISCFSCCFGSWDCPNWTHFWFNYGENCYLKQPLLPFPCRNIWYPPRQTAKWPWLAFQSHPLICTCSWRTRMPQSPAVEYKCRDGLLLLPKTSAKQRNTIQCFFSLLGID